MCFTDSWGLQTQAEKERHFIEKGGGMEKRVRRIAEWRAVLKVDSLFGNENEHPETWNLRFEMSHLRGREVII